MNRVIVWLHNDHQCTSRKFQEEGLQVLADGEALVIGSKESGFRAKFPEGSWHWYEFQKNVEDEGESK